MLIITYALLISTQIDKTGKLWLELSSLVKSGSVVTCRRTYASEVWHFHFHHPIISRPTFFDASNFQILNEN